MFTDINLTTETNMLRSNTTNVGKKLICWYKSH